MNLRRLSLTTALGVAAIALTTAATAASPYRTEYKLSTVVGTGFAWGQGAEIWADLVRTRTDGRINIKLYPGVALVQGDQTREFSAIRQGVIDMAVGSTINWSPQVRQLNLFSLPFLMPDYAAVDALTQGGVGTRLFEAVEKAGVVPLAWGENGYRQLSNAKHEIRRPSDLKGLKLRVVGSPLYMNIFTALGANPTQMSWSDAQPALASGAVDGQENPVSVYLGSRLYSVGQKYLTLWNYVNDPLMFVVNRQVWNSWTEADREIVRLAAIEAGRQQIMLARKGMTAGDSTLLDELQQQGVHVTRLSPEEHQAFVDATRAVYQKWKQHIGADLVGQAEQVIAARAR